MLLFCPTPTAPESAATPLPVFVMSAQRRACRLVLMALVMPAMAFAQVRMTARDSTILAAPFAQELGVNPATMRLLAPALFVDDLTQGTGIEARRGMIALVRDEVWRTDGTRVKSGTCASLQFQIGTGTLIDGVETAVRGMQPGGTRLMVVGAERAYGSRGVDGEVTPGSTLVVRVQLLNLSEGRFPNPDDCQRA